MNRHDSQTSDSALVRSGAAHAHPPATTLATRNVGLPALLRGLSGRAAGWLSRSSRASRRGSFLVIVVGTLALLAVIAVIYVTIGRADARTQAAVSKRSNLDDVPRQFADYVAHDIIARDALATIYDSSSITAANGQPVLMRENSDFPWTDPTRRSDSTLATSAFDPVGEFSTRFVGPIPPSLAPSDPWLASSEPIFLDFAQAGYTSPPGLQHTEERDWFSTSNVAPDGRFVNLVNLRNNFEAQPGVGNDANGNPRLSEGLSLLDAAGAPTTDADTGLPADPNVPFFWTMRQRGTARPLTDPAHQPGDAAFFSNQWADADGDGLADSRWFEMVDARDLASIRSLLNTDQRYRYFFATRIVDLSSMVNVNLATDQLGAPNPATPAGLTPADVDLRRVLTMHDVYDLVEGSGQPGGYEGLVQPADPTSPASYIGLSRAATFGAAAPAYASLRLRLLSGTTPDRTSTGTTIISGFGALPGGWPLNSTANPLNRRAYYATSSLRFLDTVYRGGTTGYDVRGTFGVADLLELNTRRVVNDPATTSELERTIGGRDSSGGPATLRWSILRDNRPLSIETLIDINGDGVLEPQGSLLFSADVRQRLTSLSGAVPRRTIRGVSADQLDPAEVRLDARTLINEVNSTELLRGYADALLPFSGVAGAWEANAAPDPLRTLFYGGRGPESAYLAAAHMTLNLLDMADTNGRPRAATVVVDAATLRAGGAVEADSGDPGDVRQWPHPVLKLPDNRLGDSSRGESFVAPAVTAFGIEAQPFITQVASFTAYTDAPDNRGGDTEDPTGDITINGDLTQSNSDLLFRVVAVQLTNPFGVDVTLSTPTYADMPLAEVADPNFPAMDRARDFFYLTFEGRTYFLAGLEEQVYVDNATAAAENAANRPAVGDDARIGQYIEPPSAGGRDIRLVPITIPAGESIVVYTVSQIPRIILEDRLVQVDPTLSGTPQERLRSTIRRVIENTMTGDTAVDGVYWMPRLDPATGLPVLATTFDPIVTSANPEFNLWRAVRTLVDSAGDDQVETVTPSPAHWDGTARASAGPEEMPVRNLTFNDQLVDRFRTPTTTNLDRRLPAGQNDIGGTDADPSSSDQEGFSITLWAAAKRRDNPGAAGALPPRGAFPAYCIEPKYATGWNVGSVDAISTLTRAVFTTQPGCATRLQLWRTELSTGTPLIPNLASHPGRLRSNLIGPNLAGQSFDDIYAEVLIDNANFLRQISGTTSVSSLRVGDLLLPLAVGPVRNPLAGGTPAEWTTLGEAMATALGYQPGTFAPGDPMSLYAAPGPVPPSGLFFDRGQLRLDAPAPFFDADGDGRFNDADGDGAYDDPAVADERRFGLEVPHAMAIFDIFGVPQSGGERLGRAVPGLININTVPLVTARALPMISPPPNLDPTGAPWWWWASGPLTESSDIAATIVAYRDKRDVFLREQSDAVADIVPFSDIDGGGAPIPPQLADLANGRFTSSQISAIREQPGLRSIGEVLAARVRGPAPASFGAPYNIDFLAFDSGNSSRLGVDSVLYPGATAGTFVTDELDNEYKESLAIANGLAASISTRSDYFLCWFVVHGYQRADVQNLQPADPMVPSVKRRFLMIIDRSTVQRRGDKAQIVLFQEVPY